MCIINKYSNTYIKNYNELNYLNIIHIEHHKKVLQIGYIVSRLNSIELGRQYHKKEDIDMTYKNKIQYLEAIQRYGSISHDQTPLYFSTLFKPLYSRR